MNKNNDRKINTVQKRVLSPSGGRGKLKDSNDKIKKDDEEDNKKQS